ncbi:hypothetical protein GIB67_023101 [Kingdonia uniflora]|uniref:Uncharacterized protein n=1 Tax=Kingdonia uniflora TaxID=39325 RepID=A0A7J7M5J9_9MAGN|nr:hypothetical protein GIB67_023101 [Kingdonia uniflora]
MHRKPLKLVTCLNLRRLELEITLPPKQEDLGGLFEKREGGLPPPKQPTAAYALWKIGKRCLKNTISCSLIKEGWIAWPTSGAIIRFVFDIYCSLVNTYLRCAHISRASLLSVLRSVLVSSPLDHLEELSTCILFGVCFGEAMLHHVGAPFSQISPVTYLWRPCSRQSIDIDAEKNPTVLGRSASPNSLSCNLFRQLWVWIHVATMSEGYDTLRFACQKQCTYSHTLDVLAVATKKLEKLFAEFYRGKFEGKHKHNGLIGLILVNQSLTFEGGLGKALEWDKLDHELPSVMKAKTYLKFTISEASDKPYLSYSKDDNSLLDLYVSFEEIKFQRFPNLIGSSMEETGVLIKCFSLEVQLAKLEVMGTSRALFQLKKCSSLGAITESPVQTSFFGYAADLPSRAILSLTVEGPRELPKFETVSPAPASCTSEGFVYEKCYNESVLTSCPKDSTELMSSLRLKFEGNNILFSDSKDLWDSHNLEKPPVDENLLCMEKHQRRMNLFHLDENNSSRSIKANNQSSRSCPILFLKDGSRNWFLCRVGLPCFPIDFPDCKAYSHFMVTEAAASNKERELRPSATRPLQVPIQLPWGSVKFSIEQLTTCTADETVQSGKMGRCISVDQGDSSFSGFVTRTSNVLSNYLNEFNEGHLLLSPNATTGEKAKLMKEERKFRPCEKGNNHIPIQQKLCFLRVPLHAYKEGVVEEGAIVCAPRLSDISLWTSRSEELVGGLQISESSKRSYYMQQPSCEWEFQTHEDTVACESHRWPLDYVTTGFVRGSTKPVAVGFCEATLLARLRKEQWNEIEVNERRKEIYVLARNLRSAAYWLALATIVLEQQDEDVAFM